MNALLTPPLPFVLLALAGVVWARRHRAGWILCTTALALWTLFSLPVVSGSLLTWLQSEPALDLTAPLPPADAIVVLGADQEVYAPEYGGHGVGPLTLVRLRYAARLGHQTGLPILVTGGRFQGLDRSLGELMAESLQEDFGITAAWVETRAGNTLANARASADLLSRDGVRRILLVTHAWHMPRARSCFEAQGLVVHCAPTGFRVRPRPWPADFVPSSKALLESTWALHEILGRVAYEVLWL